MRLLPLAVIALALPAQEPQTIRVTTRLVEVSVIVRGRSGPVTGLELGDFTLFDQGKPQKIAFFNMNSARKLEKPAAPLPDHTFSNRLEARGETPTSATIVLLDGLNTLIVDQLTAKRGLIKFLSQIRPEDRVAVYLLSTKLRVLSDFTNNSERLLALVGKYIGDNAIFASRSAHESLKTGDPDFDAYLDEIDADIRRLSLQERAENTCAALEAIANHVRSLPGRKNLVWVTASFPFQFGYMADAGRSSANPLLPRIINMRAAARNPAGNFSAEVRRATRALNDSNMAVYPVDARGLIPTIQMLGGRAMFTNTTFDPSFETMDTIAGDTGGRVFYNTNDIQHAVRNAVDDSEVTYTLGFYPQDMDGKFHDLKVRVARDGVEVRARRGYLAIADDNAGNDDRESRMQAALDSPLEASGISISATTGSPLDLRIDLNDLTLVPKDSLWTGAFDLVTTMRAADGRELDRLTQLVELKYSASKLEAARQRGLSISRSFQAVPGAVALRIVALDRNSGRLGSLEIPLDRE